ncbi:hypothetical protein D3C85_1702340 [compost metagenome]
MLRSAASGTKPTHQRLNTGRAIRLCCTANAASSRISMVRACSVGSWGAPSSVRGSSGQLPTKAMAYRKVAKNTA